MYPQPRSALSESELSRLDHFLHSKACGREAMGLSRAHGFLSAAAAGPEALEAEEWIRLVFDEPVFSDGEQAREMLGLAMRLYQDIEHGFEHGGEFRPVFEFIRDDAGRRVDARAWAQGFMSGVNLFPEYWNAAARAELETPLRMILQLTGTPSESDFLYQRRCEGLPASVVAVHRYWHAGN